MRLYKNQPSGRVPRLQRSRRDASAPERRLLRGLRTAFPDLKWRHQTPVGPFDADIMCFSEKLVIEVDGDTHAGRETQDASRTLFIESEGFRVIRFCNDDVMNNLDGVIEAIRNSLSHWEREGAPKARKGEGDEPQSSHADPHPAALTRLAPLPTGEGK